MNTLIANNDLGYDSRYEGTYFPTYAQRGKGTIATFIFRI